MLDQELIDELKNVFAKLTRELSFVVDESTHEKQSELLELLTEVASASPLISITRSGKSSAFPAFGIARGGTLTGVRFEGIPGGHEFTSLVMALLHADEKGRRPDEGFLNRIRALQGPVELRTVISLSCENCPEVVQALNLMALTHADFKHTMVDGEFIQEEIERRRILGVPSVLAGEALLHSGKAGMAELLEKLEEKFGKTQQAVSSNLGHFDVVVLGMGTAGVSAAIYSARKGLKTAIVADKLGGQVLDTKGIENLISQTYTEGPKLAADLAAHLRSYDVALFEHRRVAGVEKFGEAKERSRLKLESGEELTAEALIVATGAKWRQLNVPGEKDYLGKGVAYCPHCDGPFFKGKDVAVIGGGNSGVEAAIDLAGIVKSVTLIEFGETLRADAVLVEKLKSLPNAAILTSARTSEVLGDGEKLTALRYEDRTSGEVKELKLAGVFVQIGLVPNSGFLRDVVELTKSGEVVIDAKGRTTSRGIFAAGDVTTVPFKQIVIAMGEGAKAALGAFEDVIMRQRGSGDKPLSA